MAYEFLGRVQKKMSRLVTPGDIAPDFELEDIQGNRIRLSNFYGQPVLLAFLRGFM